MTDLLHNMKQKQKKGKSFTKCVDANSTYGSEGIKGVCGMLGTFKRLWFSVCSETEPLNASHKRESMLEL